MFMFKTRGLLYHRFCEEAVACVSLGSRRDALECLSRAFRVSPVHALRHSRKMTSIFVRCIGGSRLRSAGILPRPDCPSSIDLESRMLSDRGQPGHSAVDSEGCRRPQRRDRLRRQVGCQRRGPQAQPQDQLLRSDGQLYGLLDPGSPACAGNPDGVGD